MRIGVAYDGENRRFQSRCGPRLRNWLESYGVCQTAQVLRLEYKKLKQLSDGEASGKSVRRRRAPATFMELVSPPAAAAECVIELEGPRGKLHIQWKGATAPDLAALSRVLWESA